MNRLPKRLTNIHHMIILLLVILLFFPTETLHSQDDDASIKALWGDDEEEENLDWLDEEIDILGIEEKDEEKDEEGEAEEDEDEADAAGPSLPNLKYAKPKYKDVESILRYVESDDGPSGVKLVIMNFND